MPDYTKWSGAQWKAWNSSQSWTPSKEKETHASKADTKKRKKEAEEQELKERIASIQGSMSQPSVPRRELLQSFDLTVDPSDSKKKAEERLKHATALKATLEPGQSSLSTILDEEIKVAQSQLRACLPPGQAIDAAVKDVALSQLKLERTQKHAETAKQHVETARQELTESQRILSELRVASSRTIDPGVQQQGTQQLATTLAEILHHLKASSTNQDGRVTVDPAGLDALASVIGQVGQATAQPEMPASLPDVQEGMELDVDEEPYTSARDDTAGSETSVADRDKEERGTKPTRRLVKSPVQS